MLWVTRGDLANGTAVKRNEFSSLFNEVSSC